MSRLVAGLSLCLLLAAASVAGAAVRDPRAFLGEDRLPNFTSIHDSTHGRAPHVTSVAFSADGKWLAASYYVSAMNEPGTDWHAWVAEWNLETGQRLILPNAYGPVAISPDSKTVAMNLYKRMDMRPVCQMALWELGKAEPQRVLKMPEPPPAKINPATGKPFEVFPAEVVAAVFSPEEGSRPGGKFLLAITQAGDFLTWNTTEDKPAASYVSWDGVDSQFGASGLTMAFFGQRGLVTVVPFTRASAVWGRVGDGGGAGNKPGSFDLGTWSDGMHRPDTVAFAANGLFAAFSGRGKTIICNNTHGEPQATVLGGGRAAFNADAKLLAVADNRGIIRLWDWKAGQILRTLRLDDRKGDAVLVAAVQCASEFGQPAKNREKLAGLVKNAAYHGAAIVVLPETSVTGYMTPDLKKTWQAGKRVITAGLEGVDPSAAAETVPGPSTEFFGKLADELGIYLTVPLLEVDKRTGQYFNTSVLLGPDGRILIHYRKRNPWPWAEIGWATPGDLGNPVADTPWGRLGCLICFDIHKQAEIMAAKKIDILLYSIAWVDRPKSDWFAKRLPDIARQSGFAIVASNWTVPKVPDPVWYGYGQSRIIGSDGTILSELKDPLEEGITYAELPVGCAPKLGGDALKEGHSE
jgi:predicted amidohydrolase